MQGEALADREVTGESSGLDVNGVARCRRGDATLNRTNSGGHEDIAGNEPNQPGAAIVHAILDPGLDRVGVGK